MRIWPSCTRTRLRTSDPASLGRADCGLLHIPILGLTSSVAYVTAHPRTLELVGWDGSRDPADVALYSHVDPTTTIDNLAAAMKMPAGAVVHFILAEWASAGSGGLLELGPTMVHRLWAAVEKAEEDRDRRGAPGGLRSSCFR